MSPNAILIRPARPGEAPILTELCIRAKAHWGYDTAFMAAASRLLRIRESEIGAGSVLTAHAAESAPCGVAAIVPLRRPNWFELSHLFVAPERLGQGVGRALFGAAVALAGAKGATHVSILSDPHAAAFYEKLGARRCGAAPSGVDRSRLLPLFELAIPHAVN
ncbi:GNAT family N-acetyltransferase [Dongia sedimenti]|uniref:GNAT family N-acetyltransferase n=1 Tax=Dongia sedimenti TaxID=3064282 RepID=A0ABU0YR72_9PROT|nr:GNAT family N-acetyltransferase [Rhodospirillaceae bacterium R-7]